MAAPETIAPRNPASRGLNSSGVVILFSAHPPAAAS